jgi:hypothetical protein
VSNHVDDNEGSHVPTADRVARLFGAREEESSSEDEEDESLEEIDFADIASFKEKVEREAKESAATMVNQKQSSIIVEETFTGFYLDATPSVPGSSKESKILTSRTETAQPLGVTMQEEEEVIVYVAPHPRTGRTCPTSPTKAAAAQELHSGPIEVSNHETHLFSQSIDPVSSPIHTPTVSLPSSYSVNIPNPAPVDAPEISSTYNPPQSSGLPTAEDPAVPSHAPHEVPNVSLNQEQTPPHPTADSAAAPETTAAISPVELAPKPSIAPEFSSISFSFASSSLVTTTNGSTPAHVTGTSTPARNPALPAIPIGHRAKKAKVKQRQREARALRRKLARRGGFGSFGAIVAEAALYSGDEDGGGRDPRREERRRGDSDVDWGDEDDEPGKRGAEEDDADVDGLSTGLEGMDIDPDVGSMRGFLESMRVNGGRHVTMDDIADEARIREEDEEDDDSRSGSTDREEVEIEVDIELAVSKAERMEIGESSDDDDNEEELDSDDDDLDDDDDANDDLTPNASFEARLARLREQSRRGGGSRNRQPATIPLDEDDEDDDDNGFPSWADADEDFYDQIQVTRRCSFPTHACSI